MTLREQVAEAMVDALLALPAVAEAHRNVTHDVMADAAIRVVLAAVTEQIDESLRNRLHEIELDDVRGYERALDDVLAVVARLGGDKP